MQNCTDVQRYNCDDVRIYGTDSLWGGVSIYTGIFYSAYSRRGLPESVGSLRVSSENSEMIWRYQDLYSLSAFTKLKF